MIAMGTPRSDPRPVDAALRAALRDHTPLPDGRLALPDLGVLAVTGPDARRFLQGYATCDMDALTPERCLRGAFCNQKGRVLTSFRAVTAEPDGADSVLLVMHAELVEPTREMLARYVVFSKAEVAVASWTVDGLTGAGALAAAAGTLGAEAPEPGAVVGATARLAHLPPGGAALYLRPAGAALPAELEALPVHGPDAWDVVAVARGLADASPATSLAHVPQALNLPETDAVSFTKGCYLGQEIVARLQYRGRARHRLFRLGTDGDGDGYGGPGARLRDARGADAGTVVAPVVAGAVAGRETLAVLRTDAEAPLRVVADDGRDGDGADGAAWRVLPLPYAIPQAEDAPTPE
jgi:folate-binding protein YgfZ